MTEPSYEGADATNDQLSDAYRDAVGSVMAARKLYDQACKDHGTDSWAAKRAQDYLTRETDHRNQLRDRYDVDLNPGSRR